MTAGPARVDKRTRPEAVAVDAKGLALANLGGGWPNLRQTATDDVRRIDSAAHLPLALIFGLPTPAEAPRRKRDSADDGDRSGEDWGPAQHRSIVTRWTLALERVRGSVGRAWPKIAHAWCDEAELVQHRQRAARIARACRAQGEGAKNCEQKGRKRSQRPTSKLYSGAPPHPARRRQTRSGGAIARSGCARFRTQVRRARVLILFEID